MRGTLRKKHGDGYTFIRPDGDGLDVFLHVSGMDDPADWKRLAPGMAVEYELTKDRFDGRDKAARVRLLASHAVAAAMAITALVEERHPRGDTTAVQTLRLGMAKLVEELAEAGEMIQIAPRTTTPDGLALEGYDLHTLLGDAGATARAYFRYRQWLTLDWTREANDIDLDRLRAELTDCYIVLVHLSRVLVEVSGQEFDLEAAALAKATADLARSNGVKA